MKYPAYIKYKKSGVEWLSEVPEHWEIKRGRFSMLVNPTSLLLRSLDSDDEISFVPMEAVGEYGGVRLDQTRIIGEIGGGYTEFQDGDVVVAKITPCFENGKGALVYGLKNKAAYGTTELHVLRILSTLNNRFLFYITITDGFRKFGKAEMYGAGGQKRVPPEFCKDFPFPLPPLKEQTVIADFLDQATRKIDTLVAKKHALIGLLKEKRTAFISRTVTRGLPPEVASEFGLEPHTRFKDSGIEWLGEVLEGWEVKRVKHIGQIRYGLGEPPEYDPEGIPFIRATDIYRGKIDLGAVKKVSPDDVPWNRRPKLEINEILVVRSGAYTGDSAIVTSEVAGCLAGYDMVLTITKAVPYFVAWVLLSKYMLESQIQIARLRAAQPHLNAEELGDFIILIPSQTEQIAIATYLDREIAKIDKLIEKVETVIERLQEYRTALITAAVTGKIDVREAAA